MFITARKGERAVNLDHVIDIELLSGCYPPDPVEGKQEPYRIVAHMTDQSTIELVREEDEAVAAELMQTYIRMLNRSDRGEI